MSQVDSRNSSAAKRARTDGGGREDDWKCPSCANVNFSFRTTCNMRSCTQPRPPKSKAYQFFQQPPYGGGGGGASVAPPYIAFPPYAGAGPAAGRGGPSLFPPPFSGYHYNYATRGNTYRPIPLSVPPPPYSVAPPIIANGGIYSLPPLPMVDRYGLSLTPMSPAAMGPPRQGFFLDEKSPQKDAGRDNLDWACPKCGNMNFSFRTVCNMRKCNTPKPEPQHVKSDKNLKQKMPEGSWKCEKCGNINYPFRTKCNRQNCGAEKPSELQESPSAASEGSEQ